MDGIDARTRAFIGRLDELHGVGQRLREALVSQRPHLAVVAGEAGIGKTRLLQELVSTLPDARVLRAQGRERSWHAPFQLVRECLEPCFLDWDELPGELEPLRHALSHLMVPHVVFAAHPQDGHEHHAVELAGAAIAVLRHLGRQGPVVLLIDDVQWGDEDSLEVLVRLPDAVTVPLVILASCRSPVEPQSPARSWLEQVARSTSATVVDLDPFSVEESARFVASLAQETIPRGLAERLHERTGGNAFFLEELWRSVRDRGFGSGGAAELQDAPITSTARQVVADRVDRLPPTHRQVVDHAAVLGPTFPLELLEALTDLDDEALLESLRTLVDRGILVEQDADRFAFRHALTQEAVAADLLHRQRSDIHRRALQVLEASDDADTELLIHHAAGAGEVQALARHAERGAANALERGAHQHAFRLASKAIEHAADSRALHMVLSRSALVLGDLDAAVLHADRWEERARDFGRPDELTQACCHRAWVHWSRGEREEAWSALLRGRPSAGSTSEADPGSAWWEAVHAQLSLLEGRSVEAGEHAKRAIDLATEAGDRRVLGHARVTRAMSLAVEPPEHPDTLIDEAVELLAAAQRDAAERGDMEGLARALHNNIPPGFGVATLDGSRRLIEEARELIELHGLVRFGQKLDAIEAYVAALDGDLDVAKRLADDWTPGRSGIDEALRAGWSAAAASEAGDLTAARRFLAPYQDLDPQSAVPVQLADIAEGESYLAAAAGDAELGRAALERMGAAQGEVGFGAAMAWWDIAVNALRSGVDPGTIRKAMDRHAPHVSARSVPARAHLLGRLAAAEGGDDDALEQLAIAVGEPRGSRPAVLRTDAKVAYATVLARTGDVAGAREQASDAREVLARWPGWRRQEVEDLLVRLGVEGSGNELLTPRETEVCRLVARGFTNGQIAERLFIAPKTASVHVSNILRKTGLERRTQVADWANRQGLIETPGSGGPVRPPSSER